jgi:hypothetical protein
LEGSQGVAERGFRLHALGGERETAASQLPNHEIRGGRDIFDDENPRWRGVASAGDRI